MTLGEVHPHRPSLPPLLGAPALALPSSSLFFLFRGELHLAEEGQAVLRYAEEWGQVRGVHEEKDVQPRVCPPVDRQQEAGLVRQPAAAG